MLRDQVKIPERIAADLRNDAPRSQPMAETVATARIDSATAALSDVTRLHAASFPAPVGTTSGQESGTGSAAASASTRASERSPNPAGLDR